MKEREFVSAVSSDEGDSSAIHDVEWGTWRNTELPPENAEYAPEPSVCPFDDDWSYSIEYLKGFAYELQEVKRANLDLMSFQEWIALERFLGQRISYEQYQDLCECIWPNEDDVIDGDVLEYVLTRNSEEHPTEVVSICYLTALPEHTKKSLENLGLSGRNPFGLQQNS